MPELKLKDGTQVIILNATGTEQAEACELREFLKYVSVSTEEVVKKSQSVLLKKIHEKVEKVRRNTETEVEYLTLLERDEMNYEQGKNEGFAKGMELGRTEGMELGRTEGVELGRIQGVYALIADNLEEGITRERIIEKLKIRFDLSKEIAEEYFRKFSE